MEIRTCEEYVLNELNKAQEVAESAKDVVNELQRVLYTVQNYLELYMDDDGIVSIEVDPVVQANDEIKNLFIQLLGRGKYAVKNPEADAAENVEA